ncbi:Phosphoribosylformylglycinamidine synthase 2 protein [Candidatus Micropelagos thuwalensis]|uniref:Phosphoribosylformylglycinamidine synthase 2 protein n=2 Tax=Candidatus Micropelagius thuwalensis TaxID=1397666 RepID=U2XPI7_9PROT|nr:Phosphoribosylformylglycinamidine synthase 2 protein [Candidatus Micropelagos thuwalensis]
MHMMRIITLLTLFFLIFPNQTFAQINIEKGKVVYFFKNECKDIEGAMKKYEKLFEYQFKNQPKPQVSRCGRLNDGMMGCVVVTNSVEDYEANVAWQENDDQWNTLIREGWRVCEVDDFGFQLDILRLE